MLSKESRYAGAETDYRKEKQLPGPVFFKPYFDSTEAVSKLEARLQSAPSESKYLFRDAIESLKAKSEVHRAIANAIAESRVPALVLYDIYVQHGGASARIDFLLLLNQSIAAIYDAEEQQRSFYSPDRPRDFDENMRALGLAQQSTYTLWGAMRTSRKVPSKALRQVHTFVVPYSPHFFDETPRDFRENSLIYNEIRQAVGVLSSELSRILRSLCEKNEKPLFRVKQQYALAEWLAAYSKEVSSGS